MADDSRTYTTIFKADVSQFSKSTQDMNRLIKAANAEFKNATASLGKWSDSQEGLNAKLKQLGTTLTAEEQKLSNMVDAYKDLEREGKANTKQAQDLRDKINEQQAKVKGIKSDIDHYSDSLKELADAGAETREDLEKLNKEQEDFKNNAKELGGGVLKGAIAGIAGIATACIGAVKGLSSLVDETKELRTQLGMLETAFTTNGHSAQTAEDTYNELYGVLGDSGKATEAALHLAQVAKSEEDLASLTNSLTGIYASFGDSLPIESLSEGISVTASLGTVTGTMADALEFSGQSVDDFNAELATMSTEEERQQHIISTLNELYGEQATKYKEVNKDVIAANEAQAQYDQTLAGIAETVQPAMTSFKLAMVTALQGVFEKLQEVDLEGLMGKISSAIQYMVDNVLPPLLSVITWVMDNISWLAPLMLSLVGIIGGISAAIKIYNTVVQIAKTVQMLWNAALLANPIGLVVIAITALVAAFVILWNKCEGFRNFWKKLWDGIKEVAGSAADFIGGIFSSIGGLIKGFVNGIISGVNTAIGWLNKIKIPDWKIFGKYAGKGINIKTIPELAKGGIVDKDTIARVGEAGKEAVVPLENNTGWIDELAKALNKNGVGGGNGGGDIIVNNNFGNRETTLLAQHKAKLELVRAVKLARGV